MNTTISISKELKEKITELGKKGETYSDIIERLYNSAKKRQLYDLLMSEKGTVPIEYALKRARKRWPK